MNDDEAPGLFVPGADDAESAWQELHERTEQAMGRAYADDKIYSMSFTHDGIEYDAKVGESRRATEYPRTRGNRDYSRAPRRYASGNPIMAIFAGVKDDDPYLVWEVLSDRPSVWANPAMVGPRSVRAVRKFRAQPRSDD